MPAASAKKKALAKKAQAKKLAAQKALAKKKSDLAKKVAAKKKAATKKNTKVRGAHSRILKNRSTYRALLLSSVRSTTRARLNGSNG